jgi:hypothetical protein
MPLPPVHELLVAGGAVVGMCLLACSSDGPSGGPVAGAQDTHCVAPDGGQIVQETSAAACTQTGAGAADYGETLYNARAADDDCKYDVGFSVTPVRKDEAFTFVVTATHRTDGGPLTGAATRAEIFLNDTHPAPNAGTNTTEAPPGTYTIGPVKVDASGRWTTRFHFFESCDDSEESPHGHVAFFIDAP